MYTSDIQMVNTCFVQQKVLKHTEGSVQTCEREEKVHGATKTKHVITKKDQFE